MIRSELDWADELGARNPLGVSIVASNALGVPFGDELPYADKDGCARLYDTALWRIAAARTPLERQVGRRIAALREARGYVDLGLSSMADYAIERLGMSERQAQRLARIARGLEELPLLREACDTSRLSISQLDALVGVATAETEAAWLERATALTVRGLREEIRQHKHAGTAAPPAGDPTEEERVRVSFEAPPRVVAKWQAGLELFRKLEGHDRLPVAEAAEAFAAEWRSGLAVQPEATPDDVEAARAGEVRGRWQVRKGLEELTNRWDYLTWERIDFKALFVNWDRALPCDAHGLDRELRELRRLRQHLEALTGRILLTMARVGLFKPLYFTDIGHYAMERLGLGSSTAAELKSVERWLFEMPTVARAYYRGELGLSKVKELVKVAPGPHEAAWLKRARAVTVRRLADDVRYARQMQALYEADLIERPDGVLFLAPPPAQLTQAELQPSDRPFQTSARGGFAEELKRDGAQRTVQTLARWGRISFSSEPAFASFWRESVAMCRAVEGRSLPEWACAERFVDAFFETWSATAPEEETLAQRVVARDGYRCTVPGCRNRSALQAHHVVWRSRGGSDEERNLTCACELCHLEGIHGGRIRVRGEAPHELVWELGVTNGDALTVIGPGERVLFERHELA